MKSAFALPLALAFALLVGVPVSAAPPVVDTGAMDMDYVAFDPSPCPGIEIRDHEVLTYRMTSFSDKQGNPVRTHIYIEGTDNFYNPVRPDIVLSGHFTANIDINEVTGEQSEHGVPYHITVPGYGTVLVRAGRWIQAGQIAGKNSLLDPTDVAQLCSVLAGG